jgi:hypothetical protein
VTRALRASLAACTLSIACAFSLACAVSRPLVSSTDDYADYRAFRLAAHEGPRLARAQHYLDAHPQGAWASEVRAAFDAEEPAFFEAAKTSRRRALDYLVDLPRGPHAAAALALLEAFDAKDDDFETTKLLAAARRTDAMLDRAASRRRAVGDLVVGDVAALLGDGVYGVAIEEAPIELRRMLGGLAPTTWGALRTRVDVDVSFVLPTPAGSEERVASVELSLKVDAAGAIVEGRVWGPDLFVRWAEADGIRPLDANAPSARGAAATHAIDVIGGAIEWRLPGDRCGSRAEAGEIFARSCDGWHVAVTMGEFAGAPDVILVRGPRASRK